MGVALICAVSWIFGAFRPVPIETVYFYNAVCGSCDDYGMELLNRLSDANRRRLTAQLYKPSLAPTVKKLFV